MFMFIGLVLFASLGFLNAACPTRQVGRCAKPLAQANPSDISQICRLRNDVKSCLQAFAADCTGDSTFNRLSRSIQVMAEICPSSNEINQGNVCPINVVTGCAGTYAEGMGSLGGPSSENIARLCSLNSDLRNCLQPYDAACVGNNMYEMLKQSLERSENMCPPSTLIPGYPNGRHDESHPEMIINSTEIVEDQGMVINSTDTAHDDCIDEVMKCSSGIDQSAYIPPGSLSKGFYISKYFLYRYCSTGRNVSKCVQDSKILGEPKCSYIAEPLKQQFAIWKAVCTGRGYKVPQGNEIDSLPVYYTEDKCSRAYTVCVHTVDLRNGVPPGSLTKGFYFSPSFIRKYCSTSSKLLECVQRSQDLNTPECRSFSEPLIRQVAMWNVTCTGQGFTDIMKLRSCMNKHEMQLDVYGFEKKITGILEGWQYCKSNMTSLICSGIPPAIDELIEMVESRCGSTIANVFKGLVKRLAIVIMDEDVKKCPGMMPWVNNL